MGELTIEGSVDFCTSLNEPTLSMTKLTIDGSDGEIRVTNSWGAQITVE